MAIVGSDDSVGPVLGQEGDAENLAGQGGVKGLENLVSGVVDDVLVKIGILLEQLVVVLGADVVVHIQPAAVQGLDLAVRDVDGAELRRQSLQIFPDVVELDHIFVADLGHVASHRGDRGHKPVRGQLLDGLADGGPAGI